MDYINDLNNLLPEDIENLINKLTEILRIVKCKKILILDLLKN